MGAEHPYTLEQVRWPAWDLTAKDEQRPFARIEQDDALTHRIVILIPDRFPPDVVQLVTGRVHHTHASCRAAVRELLRTRLPSR